MGRNLRHIALGIIAGVVILLILLLILPIKVVYDVPVESRAHHSKEWKLLQDGEQFRTELTNYADIENTLARNFVFERGDVIDIEFNQLLTNGDVIDKDDLLLQFKSMMHTMRIQRALNEIDIQESLKSAGGAAMKAPLGLEANEAVELARSNVRLQQANFDRLSQLLEDGVISKAELDAQTNRLEIAAQELSIAEQRLVSTSFEVKPEDIAVFTSRIQSMDKELDVLLAQQNSYAVQSPFTGRIQFGTEEGVLISLSDTGRQSLLFPFPISERELLAKESFLEVSTRHGDLRLPFSLKNEVGLVHGTQNCLGVALVDSEAFSIGEIVSAKVVCDTVLLREYLFRKLL